MSGIKWFDLSAHQMENRILVLNDDNGGGQKRFAMLFGEGVEENKDKLKSLGFSFTPNGRAYKSLAEVNVADMLGAFEKGREIELSREQIVAMLLGAPLPASGVEQHNEGEDSESVSEPEQQEDVTNDSNNRNSGHYGTADQGSPTGGGGSGGRALSGGGAGAQAEAGDEPGAGNGEPAGAQGDSENNAGERAGSGEDRDQRDRSGGGVRGGAVDLSERLNVNRPVKIDEPFVPKLAPALASFAGSPNNVRVAGDSRVDADERRAIIERIIDLLDPETGLNDGVDADFLDDIAKDVRAHLNNENLSWWEYHLTNRNRHETFISNIAFNILVDAIEPDPDHPGRITLKQLTDDQKEFLAAYNGFGNFKESQFARLVKAMINAGVPRDTAEAAGITTRLTAMFTPWVYAKGLWDMARTAGFEGGQVVEFGCGTGRFVGAMPVDLRDKARYFGVEKDPVSAAVARALYPEQTFVAEALENLPKEMVPRADLIVGNIPFGNVSVYDPVTGKTANIHHYFTRRILETVKPGGIAMYYNTAWFMSSKDSGVRKALHREAELLGVVRVTSELIANADMGVMDLLIVRKRKNPLTDEQMKELPDWVVQGQERDEWMRSNLKTVAQLRKQISQGEQPFEKGKPFAISLSDSARLDSVTVNTPGGRAYFAGNDLMYLVQVGDDENDVVKRYMTPAQAASLFSEVADMVRPVLEGKLAPMEERDATHAKPMPSLVDADLMARRGVGIGNIVLDDKDGTFRYVERFDDTRTHFVLSEEPIKVNRKDAAVLSEAIALRDALFDLLNASSDPNASAEEIKSRLDRVNVLYDGFVEKHGYITNIKNSHPIRKDMSWPLLQACEVSVKDQIEKSALLNGKTLEPPKRIERTDDPKEALFAAYAEGGMLIIDLRRALALMGHEVSENASQEQVYARFMEVFGQTDANLLPFYDPESGLFEHPDYYLSGDLAEKIDTVTGFLSSEPEMAEQLGVARNLEALKAALPRRIAPEELDIQLGVNWVPADIYKKFSIRILKDKEDLEPRDYLDYWDDVSLNYSPEGGWHVEVKRDKTLISWARHGNSFSYEPNNRWSYDLLRDALNGKKPVVKNKEGKIDGAATASIQNIVENIEQAWRDWLTAQPEVMEKLAERYNHLFNSSVPYQPRMTLDTLPGMSQEIELRPHQKRAVARAMAQQNVLFAHEVGAGKTFTMIASIMAARHYGLVDNRRPAVMVVKKATLSQIGAEAQRLFPNARIMVMDAAKTSGKEKNRFLAQMVHGDNDIVVMTYETFKSLKFSPREERNIIQAEIDRLEDALMSMDATGANDDEIKTMPAHQRRMTKSILRKIESLRARLEKLMKSKADTQIGVYFDAISPSMLVFDEAHTLKNMSVSSHEQALSQSGSAIADDAYAKVSWLRERDPNFRLIFATGTPISNNFNEMYALMRFLAPDVLRRKFGGDSIFGDGFFRSFITPVNKASLGVDGQYTTRTMINLINVPELARLFRSFADVVFMRDTKVERVDAVQHIEKIAPTALNKVFSIEAINRSNAIKKNLVEPDQDNLLKLASDGKAMAVDARLYRPEAPAFKGSKVDRVVVNVLELYNNPPEGAVENATQAIFLDSGTPTGTSYNLYQEIKDKLIEGGIPADQIAFAHDAKNDAKRQQLFNKVNEGEVRIIIGSTEKMGVGVNMQKRLVALHHVDVPRSMRPADVEQREGRIIRQGNMNKKAHIYYYGTEGSFDLFLWALIDRKQNMITQIMRTDPGDLTTRTIEDEGDGSSYAQIVEAVTGSNTIRELVELQEKYRKNEALIKGLERQILAEKINGSIVERNIQEREKFIEWAQAMRVEVEAVAKQAGHDETPALMALGNDGKLRVFEDEEALRDYVKALAESVEPGKSATAQLFLHGVKVEFKAEMSPWRTDVELYFTSPALRNDSTRKLGIALGQCKVFNRTISNAEKEIERMDKMLETISTGINEREKRKLALVDENRAARPRIDELEKIVHEEMQAIVNLAEEYGAASVDEWVHKFRKGAIDCPEAIRCESESKVTEFKVSALDEALSLDSQEVDESVRNTVNWN